MGMLTDYMRLMHEPSQRQKEQRERYSKMQSDRVSKSLTTERKPIPDMNEQLKKVRQSKVGLNRSLINATSSVTKDKL